MKICKRICRYVANHKVRVNYAAVLPPQGGYARSVVFRGAQRLCAVGAEDQCAFSSGGNNFLRVTDLKAYPLSGGYPVVQKRVELALNPSVFMVELARIELAAS